MLTTGIWYTFLLGAQIYYIARVSMNNVDTSVQLPSVVMATLVFGCFLSRVVAFWLAWCSGAKKGRWCLTYVWIGTLAVWVAFVVWELFLVPARIKHWNAGTVE